MGVWKSPGVQGREEQGLVLRSGRFAKGLTQGGRVAGTKVTKEKGSQERVVSVSNAAA